MPVLKDAEIGKMTSSLHLKCFCCGSPRVKIENCEGVLIFYCADCHRSTENEDDWTE
jgi:hypothetical protein